MKMKKLPTLLILGNPHSNEATKAFLKKLINILLDITEKIYIMAGDEVKADNISVFKITGYSSDKKPNSLLSRVVNFLRIQLKIIKILRKILKTQIPISATIILPQLMVLPLLYIKLKGIPTILYVGGRASKSKVVINLSDLFLYALLRFLEMIAFNLADCIVVEQKHAIKFLDLDSFSKKIFIIPQGVDATSFRSIKSIRERRNIVGYIGRLSIEKGILNFVKAIPETLKERSDIEFLIGGDGQLKNIIEKYIIKQNLQNKVKLLGWIPHNKIPIYLNELKLLVIPSYSEGLPNILLEAMACGTPVLATPVGAIPDLIKDKVTGFIINDNSPKGIARSILEVLRHEDLEEIAKNARLLIEKNYNIRKAKENWYRVITMCINKSSYSLQPHACLIV